MRHLRIEKRENVAIVSLDRPPANALDHELCVELNEALCRAKEPDVAAVVLTGTGRFFSAGLDLFKVFEYPEPRARDFANAFDDAISGWFALDKPVVAAVNGHAIAGGAVLASTADFRLVAECDSKHGLTEIAVGVPFPTSALEVVRYACAGPKLKEILFRGRIYKPAEAVSVRLHDEVVPPGELMSRAIQIAMELGSHRHDAFALPKEALRSEFIGRMRAARSGGTDPIWERWRAPDLKDVMERFRESTLSKQ